jgi:hypothetical protein
VVVGANVNISKLIDNQAESTIAIDPTNANNVFAASITHHGGLVGTFDPNVNVQGIKVNHKLGFFAATSGNAGAAWNGRIMATGGPTEASVQERSLPAAFNDPQAAFDDYGNLYLTYRTDVLQQFGTATAGGAMTLADANRQWKPNMWVGMVLTIRPGQGNAQSAVITGNTATQLTIGQAWNMNPANGDPYKIEAGALAGQALMPANSAIVLLSTDDGASFSFLKILDTGPVTANPPDFPSVATGPGRNANEKSVWLAWRGSSGTILATGAPVTGKGAVGAFIATQTVDSATRASPRVAVGPNGQVMVTYTSVAAVGGASVNIYTNVDDNGLGPNPSFRNQPTQVGTTNVIITGPGPGTFIPAQPDRGIMPDVNLAWDRSGTYVGAPNGRVYLIYTYNFGGPDGNDTDILVRKSDDSGVTWSDSTLLTSDLKSQFMPSIAVDQKNGDVAAVWLDAKDDPANVKVRMYGTVSGDGGVTYLAPFQIAQTQSDATITAAPQMGQITGPNRADTIVVAGENWQGNYWAVPDPGLPKNFNLNPPDPGLGMTQWITSNTATAITVSPGWTVPPVNVGPFQINPLYAFDYGDYTGVAFFNGKFLPVWSDNSNSTGDNPDQTPRGWLDLYTAAVTVTHPNAPIRLLSRISVPSRRVTTAQPAASSTQIFELVQSLMNSGVPGIVLTNSPSALSVQPPIGASSPDPNRLTEELTFPPSTRDLPLPVTNASEQSPTAANVENFSSVWGGGIFDLPSSLDFKVRSWL